MAPPADQPGQARPGRRRRGLALAPREAPVYVSARHGPRASSRLQSARRWMSSGHLERKKISAGWMGKIDSGCSKSPPCCLLEHKSREREMEANWSRTGLASRRPPLTTWAPFTRTPFAAVVRVAMLEGGTSLLLLACRRQSSRRVEAGGGREREAGGGGGGGSERGEVVAGRGAGGVAERVLGFG